MKKGFTLIELLVVVAIVSLLSSIVFASLNSARGKARNAARIQIAQTIYSAFNLSLGSAGFPATGTLVAPAWACVSSVCNGDATFNSMAAVDNFLATALPNKPTDPTGGNKNYWGVTYINPAAIGGVFGTGAFIRYFLEKPATACGPGQIWGNQPGYLECLIKLD